MAAESVIEVIIRAKNELGSSLQQIRGQLEQVQKTLTNLQAPPEVTQNLEAIGDALEATTESTSSAAVELASLGTIAQTLGKNLLYAAQMAQYLVKAFFALQAVRLANQFLTIAGRAEVLGTVLNVVGTNAGIATQKLKEMEEAIRSQGITASAARSSLTLLIQSQLISAETADKAAKLARAAQDLAVVTGQNSSETFRRLVINIQQLDSVGLRWMGLMVDRNRGEKEYAETLGKSVNQLTLVERRQAFLNSALKEAAKLQGTYEASMSNAAKQIQSLARYEEEFQRTLGESLLPVQLVLVEEFTALLKDLTAIMEESTGIKEFWSYMADGLRDVLSVVREVIVFFFRFKEILLVIAGIAVFSKMQSALTAYGQRLRGVGTDMAAWRTLMASAERELAAANIKMAESIILLNAASTSAKAEAWEAVQAAVAARNAAAAQLTSIQGAQPVAAGLGVGLLANFPKIAAWVERIKVALQAWAPALTRIGSIVGGIAAGFLSWIGWITMAYLLLKTVWNWWESRQQSSPEFAENAKQQANEIIQAQRDISQQIRTTQKELDDALARDRASGVVIPSDEVERLTSELEKLNQQEKQLAKDWDAFLDGIKDPALLEYLRELPQNMKLATNELVKRFSESATQLSDIRKKLGLEKLIITPEFVIDRDFQDKADALKQLLEDVLTPPDIQGEIRTNIQKIEAALTELQVQFGLAQSEEEANRLQQKINLLQQQLSAAKTTFDQLQRGEIDLPEAPDMQEFEVALEAFVQLAKNADQAAYALTVLDAIGAKNGKTYSEFRKTLEERLNTSSWSDLSKAIEGTTNAIQRNMEAKKRLTNLDSDAFTDRQKVLASLAQFGVPLNQLNEAFSELDFSILSVKTSLVSLADTTQTFTSLAADALRNQAFDLKQQFDIAFQGLEQQFERTLDYIDRNRTSQASYLSNIEAATKQHYDQTLKNTETYYEGVKRLRDQSFNEYISSLQKVQTLQQQVLDLNVERRDTVSGLRTSLLTEEEQYWQRRRELAEADREFRLASQAQEFQEAETIGRKRIELLKQQFEYQKGQGYEDEALQTTRLLDSAYRDLISTKEQEVEINKQAAEENLTVYRELEQTVRSVRAQLVELANVMRQESQLVIDVTVPQPPPIEVDLEVANGAIDEMFKTILDEFKGFKVPVEVVPSLQGSGGPLVGYFSTGGPVRKYKDGGYVASTGEMALNAMASLFWAPMTIASGLKMALVDAPQKASGGSITGPGTATSDSILAWLSNGEYVIQAKAVERYGESFLHAVNTLQVERDLLPKFASGGAVTPGPVASTQEGKRDMVDVTFNIGSRKMSLMGERDQVRALISSLKDMEVAR